MITNTFVPGEAADKATYAAPGYTYADPITEHGFNMLDLLVCDAASFDKIRSLFSDKAATLATDHFLMTAVLEFESFHSPATRPKRRNVASMSEQDVGRSFADAFNESVRAETRECDTASAMWQTTKKAMDKDAVLLPKVERKANQPWISCDTLQLLELRRQARAQHDCENERKFHKEARNHAKLTGLDGWTACWKKVTGNKFGL